MSDQMTTAATAGARPPRPGRITVEESFLDLIDQVAYGDLETWRKLYAAAQADPAFRQAVARAAGLVDPDFANAGHLWRALVERMPPVQTRPRWAATAEAAGEPVCTGPTSGVARRGR
ncbi:hypothetical protein [Roseisolibacter agri]|uniref:Uncharacterized protein n=1 Tax=Roseisolibacter agri TaxID=2014610 RepID=A0AA37V2Z5_9BACT|nr:hypothetical protein [Roseisolibacter agri]GLC28585.1 hypothetical protein rosag_50980 [Roseisolibacter agri]